MTKPNTVRRRAVHDTPPLFDRHGKPVEVDSFPATYVKNEFGHVLDKTIRGETIIITKHNLPTAVMLSYAEYVALAGWRGRELNLLRAEFDALYAGMQRPKARAAMQSAFESSPEQLGKAAVAAVRKAKRTRG